MGKVAQPDEVFPGSAAGLASGGSAGFYRSNAARNRATKNTSPFVSRSNVLVAPNKMNYATCSKSLSGTCDCK